MARHKFNIGFTLPEVLITLTVIGVVSSITIPSLTANKQEIETKTKIKKIYSDYTAATQRYYLDNSILLQDDDYEDIDILREYFLLTYFSYQKDCYLESCTDEEITYKTYDGKNQYSGLSLTGSNDLALILNDGSAIYYSANGETHFDINGPYTSPNVLGKDLFYFYYNYNGDGKLIPGGELPIRIPRLKEKYNLCNSSRDGKNYKGYNGRGCTKEMLE